MSDKGKWVFGTNEISEIFGVSERRIQQLVKAGAISRIDRGKFHLPTVIEEYSNWKVDNASHPVFTDDGEEVDYDYENALLMRAKRHKAELELKIMRGELHRSVDIERVMNDMLISFKTKCLAIPSKTAPKLLNQTDLAVITDTIKNEVYEALNELSEYDPEMFYASSKDKIYTDEEDDESE